MKLKKGLRTLIILAAIALVLGSAGLVVRNIFLNQLKGQIDWYNRLKTEKARDITQDRVAFMEKFIAQARLEIGTQG